MATKISALPAASALGDSDAFPVVQGGSTKKATAAQIKAKAQEGLVGYVATVPATPASTGAVGQYALDADYAYFCVAANSWIRVAKDGSWV